MADEPEHVVATPVEYSHKGNPIPSKLTPWKPGQPGNPKGGKRGPRGNSLTGHLKRHFDEIVRKEIPDGSARPQVVEMLRVELLAKLMGSQCFKTDGDPGWRRDCLKAVLERIDPVATGREFEPFVEPGPYATPIERSFIAELQRVAGLAPVTPMVVLAVLQRGNGNGQALGGGQVEDECEDGGGI